MTEVMCVSAQQFFLEDAVTQMQLKQHVTAVILVRKTIAVRYTNTVYLAVYNLGSNQY